MSENTSVGASPAATRIASVDALRGLTILVMIFVNDVAGVSGTPAWMKHYYPYDADGMTFVDVVFPAFLFIVGMSLPLALGRRLHRGETLGAIWRHILMRTLSLLIIGVFMVNSSTLSRAGRLNPHLWNFLMYLGVILVWNASPVTQGRWRKLVTGLRVAGVFLLLLLAVLYRGPGEPGLIEMRPQWWGILGLIGWAYLVAAAILILSRGNAAALVGALSLLYCLYMADRAGLFSGLWLRRWVDFGAMLGSHAAITVSGVILGQMLTPSAATPSHWGRVRFASIFGLALAVAAFLLHSLRDIHPMGIINKNAATPPWCLYSSAITIGVWVVIYWLMDVRGWRRWAFLVQPAGENPLFAYILQPMLYAAFGLLALGLGGRDFYAQLGQVWPVGFWRSVLFALGVTWLAGGLRRLGVRPKL